MQPAQCFWFLLCRATRSNACSQRVSAVPGVLHTPQNSAEDAAFLTARALQLASHGSCCLLCCRRIDNPKYKGIWVAPDIDNPDFKDDPKLYLQKDIKYIGFELWQVSGCHHACPSTVWCSVLALEDTVDIGSTAASGHVHTDVQFRLVWQQDGPQAGHAVECTQHGRPTGGPLERWGLDVSLVSTHVGVCVAACR